MSDIVIKIENLGKRYRYGAVASKNDTLRSDLMDWMRGVFQRSKIGVSSSDPTPNSHLPSPPATHRQSPTTSHESLKQVHERHIAESPDYFWALRDINLEIQQGEVVGIIGRNGAGKSTLLKILSRITPPTTGKITYQGRIASLLEVGTGFHRELTGRENIYLNGSILGMRRTEITRKFDEIVAFAEVEKFIDTPVKFYSSGMYVRLAFAVAAQLEPEILVVDEVLSVGDAEFQKKCLGKMGAVAKAGRTVLFVSHNMAAVARLCSKGFVLEGGRCTFHGSSTEAIDRYLQAGSKGCQSEVDLRTAPGWEKNRRVILTSLSTHRLNGIASSTFNTGEGILFKIGYHLDQKILAYCQINLLSHIGERVVTLRSTYTCPPLDLSGNGMIECAVPDNRLVAGEYIVMLELGRQFPQAEWLDCVPEATRIQINLGDYLGGFEVTQGQGVIAQRSTWSTTAE